MSLKQNKKAKFDYQVIRSFETGIVLEGWEVKSIKAGNVSLEGSFALINKGELWLKGMHVSNWQGAKQRSDEYRRRDRKLLVKRDELEKLYLELKQLQRTTLAPLELYQRGNMIKVKLGVATGRQHRDKRKVQKERDLKRDLSRDLKYSR